MPEVAGQGALRINLSAVHVEMVYNVFMGRHIACRSNSYGIMNVDRFSTASIASQYVWIYRSILDNIN